MKITHAVWEKRNMGVDCWEVKIEKDDTADTFFRKKDFFESEYTVVKVPAEMPQYGFFLQEQGYQYVETMISLYRNTELPKVYGIQQRILGEMGYVEMNRSDIDQLFLQIRSGMFTTDRVSIDPYFSLEQAYMRYIGWIRDEIAAGAKLYKIQYRNTDAGFFVLRQLEGGVFYPAIAGIYQSMTMAGIGTAMDYFQITEANRCGGKKILGSVSTNNRKALSVAVQLGYLIDQAEVVFIKHGIKKL